MDALWQELPAAGAGEAGDAGAQQQQEQRNPNPNGSAMPALGGYTFAWDPDKDLPDTRIGAGADSEDADAPLFHDVQTSSPQKTLVQHDAAAACHACFRSSMMYASLPPTSVQHGTEAACHACLLACSHKGCRERGSLQGKTHKSCRACMWLWQSVWLNLHGPECTATRR